MRDRRTTQMRRRKGKFTTTRSWEVWVGVGVGVGGTEAPPPSSRPAATAAGGAVKSRTWSPPAERTRGTQCDRSSPTKNL